MQYPIVAVDLAKNTFRAPDIHCVPVKDAQQQAIAQLHTVREQWIKRRTATINQARALLGEHGIRIPQGAHKPA